MSQARVVEWLVGATLLAVFVGALVRRAPRLRRELELLLVTEAVVIGAMISINIRSHYGEDPSQWGWDSALVMLVLALPALFGPPLTTGPALRPMACVLAILAWALFLISGDMTCTDCGFAALIPAGLALPQLALVAISVVGRIGRRRRAHPASPRSR